MSCACDAGHPTEDTLLDAKARNYLTALFRACLYPVTVVRCIRRRSMRWRLWISPTAR